MPFKTDYLHSYVKPTGLQFRRSGAELDECCEVKSLQSEEAVTNTIHLDHLNHLDLGIVNGERFSKEGTNIRAMPKEEYNTVKCNQIFETPRGLAAWASDFEEEVAAKQILPVASSLSSHIALTKDASFRTQSPGTCATDASADPEKKSVGIVRPIISKPGSTKLRSKCDKARVDTILRLLGWENQAPATVMSPLSPLQQNGSIMSAHEIGLSRSRERKIKNRASVQRCRERKMQYYEDLEDERKTLRVENEKLAEVLSSFEYLNESLKTEA